MAISFSSTNAPTTAGPKDSANLFLKVFSGEVLVTFNAKTVLKERHRVRNITSGKSAQFAAIGKVSAGYHQPGQVLIGQSVNAGEKVVTIDDLLLTDTFISNYEEAKLHYDVRSEYTKQMGQALAQTYDRQLFALAVKNARAGTTGAVSEMPAAQTLTIGTSPSVATIIANLYKAAGVFDTNNIPEEDRFAFVPPSVYYALVQDDKLMNREFNDNGSFADGSVFRVAGFDIVKTNNLAVNHTSTTIQGYQAGSSTTDYQIDASDTAVLLMQKQALGSVHLMDVASEAQYLIDRQGTLMVSKMAVG